ncbi:MAG: aminoacyl-tRNA hydrolase [Verrucomicrobiota bacterium]
MGVSVIAGLGNPGSEYRNTRHNVGYQVVDQLAQECQAEWKPQKRLKALVAKVNFAGQPLLLVKSETYMNDSGTALGAVMRFHKFPVDSLVAIYDEINLDLGRSKISVRGSAGGHNGVSSILQHVGNGFVRYRIGIGGKPNPGTDLAKWVLGKLNETEQQLITSRMPDYISGLRLLVREGTVSAMNKINTRIPPQKNEPNSDN